MRKATMQFAIFDSEGNLIVKGSVAECAKAIGMTDKQFRHVIEVRRNGKYKDYTICDISDGDFDDIPEYEKRRNADAIRNWDAFVTPLREKYGVPVYQAKKEGR